MRWNWIFALLSLSLALGAHAQPVVSDLRVGQHGKNTRFVLNLSQKVDIEVFTLADPYRIVLDFPEVAWQLDSTQASAGLVKGFRFGLFRPGRSRMVIDLGGPGAIMNKFLLPPEGTRGYWLVLDIAPTDRSKYLASAGWPEAQAAEDVSQEPEIAAAPKAATAKRVVVIDAGHGGVDPGATGVDGTFEKDLVLSVATTLRDTLERTGKYTVVMTRDSDIFLSLKARVAVARRAKADLFVSLHADSAPGSASVRGASVYTLSETASDREAEALAKSENQSDVIAGVDLSKEGDIVTSILIDLAQRETENNSAKFAQMLVPELHRAGEVTQKSHRFAGFRVLKAPDVPSVLIELGYLSNRLDESVMNTNRWRKRMADSIARAIDTYFRPNKGDHKADANP